MLVRRTRRARVLSGTVAFLVQAPCELDDRLFNGMSRVLKRPCGPPMGLAAGSTAAVAFEPAGPGSPLPTPPNPGQLVQVLKYEREARKSMGHMFVGVEVARSKTHHGVSFEGAWLGAERLEVQQWNERALHWPPGRSAPWVRVHLCAVDPNTCVADGDLHIQGKEAFSKGVPGDAVADFRPDLRSDMVVYPAMTVIMMGQKNATGELQYLHRRILLDPPPYGAGVPHHQEIRKDRPFPDLKRETITCTHLLGRDDRRGNPALGSSRRRSHGG